MQSFTLDIIFSYMLHCFISRQTLIFYVRCVYIHDRYSNQLQTSFPFNARVRPRLLPFAETETFTNWSLWAVANEVQQKLLIYIRK